MKYEKRNMTKIDIAIAIAQDLEGINQVILAHCLNPASRYEPPYPLVLEDIVQNEKRITLVARNNEKIIGYLSLHSDKSFQDDSNNADFEMVVHPDHQKQGNGKNLLEFAILYAEKKTKLNRLIAKVLKDNDASKRLCKNFGFRVLEEENKGYLMALDIDR